MVIDGGSGDYIFIYHVIYVVFIVLLEIVLYGVFTYFTLKAPYSSKCVCECVCVSVCVCALVVLR